MSPPLVIFQMPATAWARPGRSRDPRAQASSPARWQEPRSWSRPPALPPGRAVRASWVGSGVGGRSQALRYGTPASPLHAAPSPRTGLQLKFTKTVPPATGPVPAAAGWGLVCVRPRVVVAAHSGSPRRCPRALSEGSGLSGPGGARARVPAVGRPWTLRLRSIPPELQGGARTTRTPPAGTGVSDAPDPPGSPGAVVEPLHPGTAPSP